MEDMREGGREGGREGVTHSLRLFGQQQLGLHRAVKQ